MASGRPRQLDDPSVMAGVEAALRSAARPGLATRLWRWRHEAALIAGVLLGTIGIGATLGLGWLTAAATAALAVLATALARPPSRPGVIARAWRVITPHRVRTGCTHAWIRLPPGRHAAGGPHPARNHLDRGQADGPGSGEPILYAGYGHLWPFG